MRSLEEAQRSLPDISRYLKLVTAEQELIALRVSRAKGAIINSMAASLWPYKVVAGVIEDLLQNRAQNFNLQTNTPVTSIELAMVKDEVKWKVNTSRGSCLVKHVLLATNGYTSHLLPKMVDVIQPVRGNVRKPALLADPVRHC